MAAARRRRSAARIGGATQRWHLNQRHLSSGARHIGIGESAAAHQSAARQRSRRQRIAAALARRRSASRRRRRSAWRRHRRNRGIARHGAQLGISGGRAAGIIATARQQRKRRRRGIIAAALGVGNGISGIGGGVASSKISARISIARAGGWRQQWRRRAAAALALNEIGIGGGIGGGIEAWRSISARRRRNVGVGS